MGYNKMQIVRLMKQSIYLAVIMYIQLFQTDNNELLLIENHLASRETLALKRYSASMKIGHVHDVAH